MQTGPSKNDVGPLETVVLETKHHQQMALKAVEAAYLIERPPGTWKLELQSQSSNWDG